VLSVGRLVPQYQVCEGYEFFAVPGVKTIPVEAALTLLLNERINVPQSVSNGERRTKHTPESHLVMVFSDLLVNLGELRSSWVLLAGATILATLYTTPSPL
jgi:hypothetical protein